MADSEKLLSLNKDLLTRNAELVKRLKKMKTERDDFESQSNSWKKISNDASQALTLLQRDNQKHQEEIVALSHRLDDYQSQNRSLSNQLRERSERCTRLMAQCSVQQNDIDSMRDRLNGQHLDGHSVSTHSHLNTLKFNYEQKKNEIEQILHQIQKLFAFVDVNYPNITRHRHGLGVGANVDVDVDVDIDVDADYHDDQRRQRRHDEALTEDDGLDDDLSNFDPHSHSHWKEQRGGSLTANGHLSGPRSGKRAKYKKNKKTRDFMAPHRSSQSLSDFNPDLYRRRRSLPMVLTSKQIGNGLNHSDRLSPHREEDGGAERDFVGNEVMQRIVVEEAAKKERALRSRNGGAPRHGVDEQIAKQLLGPSTSHHTHPYGVTQSSHSFFNESRYLERCRYNAVQVNLSGTKLWSKRDSLPGRKKTPRINAIPSSAGSTPLTTPQQSRRGMVSDDEPYDERDFDEDPHRVYLDMMRQPQSQSLGQNANGNGNGNGTDFASGDLVSAPAEIGGDPTVSNPMSNGQRSKLTDKGVIHDLFDMLQKETLSPASPIALHQRVMDGDRRHRDPMESEVAQSEDVHLVSLLEAEHSSSSDSDSSSD